MDNTQFWIIIVYFSFLNYYFLSSFLKLRTDMKDISDKLQSINDKMDESTQRIEALLKQIHGN